MKELTRFKIVAEATEGDLELSEAHTEPSDRLVLEGYLDVPTNDRDVIHRHLHNALGWITFSTSDAGMLEDCKFNLLKIKSELGTTLKEHPDKITTGRIITGNFEITCTVY